SMYEHWECLSFGGRHKAIELDSQLCGFRLDLEALAKHRETLLEMLLVAPTPDDRIQILAAICGISGSLGDRLEACERGEQTVELARRVVVRFRLGHLLAGHAFNLTCIKAMNRAEAAILESIDIARES